MDDPNILVGYARKSNSGGQVKLSMNVNAFDNCETYTTSDGQTYVKLQISRAALEKVLRGERVVTTIVQPKED
tara:strand:+ start:371 stop:589 length:219 start_codon:yes stop_codon:yes gene_type:complete